MRRRGTLLVAGILVMTSPMQARAFTVSAPLVEAQQMIQLKQQLVEYVKIVEQITNQITQIENQVRQIEHAYTTVQHGTQNLLRLDLTNIRDLRDVYGRLMGKISEAEYIGYSASQSWEQARNIYPNTLRLMSAEQRRVWQLQLADIKRDAAKVSLETESIRQVQERYQQRWEAVVNAAYLAEGNLQIQQAQAQALGLLGSQLGDIRQQMATQARQQTLDALEQASKTYVEETAIAQATSAVNVSEYRGAGKLFAMPRTGRE